MLKAQRLILSSLILLCLNSTSSVRAANDWSKPCFNGVCFYDLPDTPSGPSGTLKIWGSNTSIADITPAGGWEIIGCDPDKGEQNIRIVCKGIDVDGDGNNDGCSHLFAAPSENPSGGNSTSDPNLPVPTGTVLGVGDNSTTTDDEDQRANGKIVRLPEECGKQAFGRIAQAWTHEDQTIPPHISKRLLPLHPRSKQYKVKGITLDTQFQKTNRAKHGNVNFAIVGANVFGAKAPDDLNVSSLGKRLLTKPLKKRNIVHSRLFGQRRGFGDIIDGIGDAIGGAADAIGDAISSEKQFNKTISAPLDITKTVHLIEQSIDCSAGAGKGGLLDPNIGVSGKLGVDVEADIHGTAVFVVSASGSLTGLRIDSLDLSTTLNADLNGAIILSAGVGGSIDSGNIKIFEVGIPGFDFPEIFSVGPTFQVNGNAQVSLDIDTDMRIGVAYHIDDLQFDFPSGGKKSGTFNAGDTPIQLSAQPSASATGKVEAHLIPSLNLGISAFAGVAKAEVFLNLDASASMTLTVDATFPGVEANISRREAPTVEVIRSQIRGRGPIGGYYFNKRSPIGDNEAGEEVTDAGIEVNEDKKVVPHKSKKSTAASPTSNLTTRKVTEGGVATMTPESLTSRAKSSAPTSTAPKVTDSGIAPATSQSSTRKSAAGNSGSTSTMLSEVTDSAVSTVTTELSTSTSTAPGAAASAVASDNGVKFGGCLEMDAGLSVNIGADADFFGLFDPSKTIPLFEKDFTLFKKCFGDQKTRRAMPDFGSRHPVLVGRAGLKCNAENVSAVEELANEVVSASKLV